MPEIVIRNFEDKDLQQLTEIFFESSTRKDFKDQNEKEAFFFKYAGFYLKNFSEFVLVAQGKKLLGYVLGMPYSIDKSLYQIQPHLMAFEKYFEEFPSHLHINCHSEARGMGVGSRLVEDFERLIKLKGIHGLHILTGVESKNQAFYRKLGFDFQKSHQSILLMGKHL